MNAKILVQTEDESFEYVDLWFNEEKIVGYYLTKDNYNDDSVNVIFGNGTVTLQRSKELIDFLLNRYNKC